MARLILTFTSGGGVKDEMRRGVGAVAVGGGAAQRERGARLLARHEAVAPRRRAVARHRRRHHERRAVLVPPAVARVRSNDLSVLTRGIKLHILDGVAANF